MWPRTRLCTVPPGSYAVLVLPKFEGRDYTCRTAQHGCQPLSHTSPSKNNVAARVVCGCLSPAPGQGQGQACRPGLSTRNFGFVLGCCLETTHINFTYVSSGMMKSLYRYLISPYRLTAPRYGDGMGLDLACGTNYSGFRSRQPLPPPGQANVQTRRFVPIPTRAGNASSQQPQAGCAPVCAPDHQSVGTVGQRVRAPRTLRLLECRGSRAN